jgi:hypothetical protein
VLVGVDVRFSGGVELGDLLLLLLLFERAFLVLPSVEGQLHGLDGEVVALDEPFVVLF